MSPPSTEDPEPPAPTGDVDVSARLVRLEQALADEARASAALRTQLADQQRRLEALGQGREETMRRLSETRAELDRVRRERDELQKKLARLDGMQTATVALPEQDEVEEAPIRNGLPSVEELMAALMSPDGERVSTQADGHPLARDASDDDESVEMIAPELVFKSEELTRTSQLDDEAVADAPLGSNGAARPAADPADAGDRLARAHASRLLVLLDAAHPIKYPLYKKVMTIGRSENADIQVQSDFISRVHARLVTTDIGVIVEDVDSKNGVRVNSKRTERQALRHGDVIALGKLRFTFLDIAAAD